MCFFHVLSLLSPAPCVPVPPCHLLLRSVSSLIAVGLDVAVMGAALNAGGAMGMCRPVLFRYCYNVTNLYFAFSQIMLRDYYT